MNTPPGNPSPFPEPGPTSTDSPEGNPYVSPQNRVEVSPPAISARLGCLDQIFGLVATIVAFVALEGIFQCGGASLAPVTWPVAAVVGGLAMYSIVASRRPLESSEQQALFRRAVITSVIIFVGLPLSLVLAIGVFCLAASTR